ncbi:uncharacterized protein BXZ73DRAFT_40121 [Epithele typhae]|uniref:uncharacterized protein n=1 Tax=Epithele typhae TaxID=378194 RepID=UPI0020085B72|nr:uncharacterized protein BXZ73DRAFT_40121 [Epithele typhae]KAH9943392.1 hypothetical protein BXZ73DRAFT_40121 [Epithele typhae]
MKYRSPSPDNALPTPPQSPTADVSHSAITLLDSLQGFYQQERYWVHHTRAALELAITKGIDAPPHSPVAAPTTTASSLEGALSPASSTASDATAVDVPMVKLESESAAAPLSPHSPWLRRKNIMRLKIDGISIHQRKRRPHRAPPTEPSTRILEMFSELMDARMESCRRVQRLVRNANRADLFMR